MPLSVVPTSVNEPGEPSASPQPSPPDSSPGPQEPQRPSLRSASRWIDYDSHELLEMISELEDERRWARLREGILWAILLHALLLLVLFILPKYVFVPKVIQPEIATKDRDWTYIDTPRLPVKPPAPKPLVTPLRPPVIDRKTIEEFQKPAAPPAPVEEPKLAQPPAPKLTPQPVIPPSPQSQSSIQAPQPKANPRPNFALGSQNPADQLRDAMRNAARTPGYGTQAPGGGLSQHPGAGAGGLQVLSDMQGVDFSSWIHRWYYETEHTWDPLIPDEVNAPIRKSGQVLIRFKVGPDGRLLPGSMVLEGSSGDTALDRAAWGALTGSNYPPLPHEFHGPYLELRALFMYNMRPQQ